MIHDTWADAVTALLVESYWSGAWHDITDDVSEAGVTITRGRSAEASATDPAQIEFTLANSTGTYSPRVATSPLYGLIGLGTPVRVSVEHGAVYGTLDGATGYLTADDSADLSITGDIDVWVDVWLPDWQHAKTDLASQYLNVSRGWALQTTALGYVALYWTEDGTTLKSATSTSVVPIVTGRLAVRVTLDVDHLGAEHLATFYTAPRIGDPWIQLGDTVTGTGTTSLHDSSAVVRVGKNPSTDAVAPDGARWFEARIHEGIGGTLRAAPKASDGTAESSTIVDSAGVTWTMGAGATLTRRHYRFWGEIAAFTPRWGPTGAPSAVVDVEACGIRRRLGQGAPSLASALRAGILGIGAGLIAYWPCEDGAEASTLTAADGGRAGRIVGSPTMAASTVLASSGPLPELGTGGFVCEPPGHTATGIAQVRAVAIFPAAGTIADGAVLARVLTSGSIRWVDLIYHTAGGGSLQATAYDSGGTAIAGSSAVAYACDGRQYRINIDLEQDGTDVILTMVALQVGATAASWSQQTLAARSFGQAVRIVVNPAEADLGPTVTGHLTVEVVQTSVFDQADQANAYRGETAAERIARLGSEAGLSVAVLGAAHTEHLGAQGITTLDDALAAAAAADYGLLAEPRDSGDLVYRSRASLSCQYPALDCAYLEPLQLESVEGDATTANQVTVTRDAGASATATQTDGAAGTIRSGTRTDPVTLSLYRDLQTRHQAGWRVHAGGLDEGRWPHLGWDLAHPTILADTGMSRDLLLLDLGDLVQMSDPPAWLPQDDIRAIVQGLAETITPTRFAIDATCTPATVYQVGRFDTPADRWTNTATALGSMLPTAQVDLAGSQCLSVAGDNAGTDLDVRVHVALDDWTPATQSTLVAKYVNTGNQRTWALDVSTAGRLHAYLSADGATYVEATSTAATGFTDGTEHWVRLAFREDSGGAYTVQFYTSDDGAVWVQLGTTITGAATLALFESTALYQLGARSGTAVTSSMAGVITGVAILDGIDGADLVPTDPGDWTDGYGVAGTGATITDQATSTVGWVTSAGPVWTHDDGDYDMIIDGERVTVTAVTGATSPQVVTLTRAVNGILKAHTAGAVPALAAPVHYGM